VIAASEKGEKPICCSNYGTSELNGCRVSKQKPSDLMGKLQMSSRRVPELNAALFKSLVKSDKHH
jgi:hypothetical protein